MSKTFNDPTNDSNELIVDRSTTGNVRLTTDSTAYTGISITPSDAPALALAVLEAAGYSEEYEGGNCWAGPLGQAMHMLRLEAEAHERATAEARELAELEAEALELRNAFFAVDIKSWDGANGNVKADWLAVALRAREMGAEK